MNNTCCDKKTLFTSYKCDENDKYIQIILQKWRNLNLDCNIKYFSDEDIKSFFKNTQYYDTYSKMKNGVAIADFFRICYINKNGGYWFDIDLEPTKFVIPNKGNINLFDVGFGNISYMMIGGKAKQQLFQDIIDIVNINILDNVNIKKKYVMEITGPRIIQNLICEKLNIINKDGCLKGNETFDIYLKDTEYEFTYSKIPIKIWKSDIYHKLQKKYNKLHYKCYNYI